MPNGKKGKPPSREKADQGVATYFLATKSGLFRPGAPVILANAPLSTVARTKPGLRAEGQKSLGSGVGGGGAATAWSDMVPAGTPPANTVLPVISGVPQTGLVLTTTDGIWTGTPAPTFAYQWQRNDTAEALAFLARTSGLDATHTNAYSGLINGLVADGVWAKLDVLHIYATQDSTTAKLNLISASYPATPGPTPPTFVADRGFTGSTASTVTFEDTGYTPTTSPGAKFTLNSAHLSMWSLTGAAVTADGVGVNNVAVICPRYSDNNCYASVNCGFSSMSVATSDGTGFYTANRSGATAQQLYRNGTLFGSNSAVTTTLANRNMLSVGNNNAGAGYGWGGQEAAITIGSSLSATDAANLYNRLRTYMNAVGVP